MSKTLDRAIARTEVELNSLMDEITPRDGSTVERSSRPDVHWDGVYRDIHRAARTLAMIRQAKAAESVFELMKMLSLKHWGLRFPDG